MTAVLTWAVAATLALPQSPTPTQAQSPNPAAAGSARVWRTLSPGLRFDPVSRLVLTDAQVEQRASQLELFLCLREGKVHESIVSAQFRPTDFQTALLLTGAKPGRPYRAEPPAPPTGQRIKVWIRTTAADGSVSLTDAREWIRDRKTKRSMEAHFVFTGSQVIRFAASERPVFTGNDGDIVCVSNFPGSIIDVDVFSTDKDLDLRFEPYTERIPERKTKMEILFEPLVD